MPAEESIPLCVPNLSDRERNYLLECVDSGFVSSVGPFVEKFEKAFAEWTGAKYAVACASGTAAIHLALQAVGVAAGDLVLTSDFTFIASANPIIYLGATPGFIDSQPGSWNMDPDVLASALRELSAKGNLPRAVVVVHIYGGPADLGPILDLCESYGIPVVEDATEALGATYSVDYPNAACRNKKAGTIGRLGCFSFNGNKLITTGGGGMITTDDPKLAAWTKHVSCQAKLPGVAFVHDQVGYNYRMINLAGALGLAQLERIETFLARKRDIALRYQELAAAHDFGWQRAPLNAESACWMSAIAVPGRRDALLKELLRNNVGCRPGWVPLSEQEPLRNFSKWGGGIAKSLAASVLCLPSSTGLTDGQLETVTELITGWIQSERKLEGAFA